MRRAIVASRFLLDRVFARGKKCDRAGVEGLPILVSVAGAPARGEIRSALAAMGYEDGRDFLCCA